jgi:D-serine deaminase-like pyridoxal phosphate-dependent protein
VTAFLCAKTNEAEVLVDAGIQDVFVANQVIGPAKPARLARLARRARVRLCVDDADNVRQLGAAARAEGVTLEVLVEVDIGMNRCGVEPGDYLSSSLTVRAPPRPGLAGPPRHPPTRRPARDSSDPGPLAPRPTPLGRSLLWPDEDDNSRDSSSTPRVRWFGRGDAPRLRPISR